MEIDKVATHDRVRKHYGSVSAFARACEVPLRIYYQAVSEGRGRVRSNTAPRRVLERLKVENLLVVNDG